MADAIQTQLLVLTPVQAETSWVQTCIQNAAISVTTWQTAEHQLEQYNFSRTEPEQMECFLLASIFLSDSRAAGQNSCR
jgi:hypothetical protein